VIPAAFTYRRASSVDEALGLLAEHGDDVKALAGGQSLLPLMKLRLTAPEVLVDVAGLEDLRYVRFSDGVIHIGSMTRYHELNENDVLREHAPLLAHAAGEVGDRQIRHRGTIGGSLAHADPGADLPASVLASDAVLVVKGANGTREIPAAEFFLDLFATALEPDELLMEIRVPDQAGLGWGFEKFARRSIDWGIVGVAVVGGNVGLINMDVTPVRATRVEAALAEGATPEAAAELAGEGTNPASEPHASAAYRRHLARVLTARALATAVGAS
jgi:aerobic carbon-monoxide dehydrogenase medium subunit